MSLSRGVGRKNAQRLRKPVPPHTKEDRDRSMIAEGLASQQSLLDHVGHVNSILFHIWMKTIH